MSDRVGPGPVVMARILRLALRVHREPVPYARAVADLVVRYLRHAGVPLEGRRVLDVGTGGGSLPDALGRAGARVVAVDVEDRRRGEFRDGSFAVASGHRLPFADEGFDLVVSSNVLEHVPDGPRLVSELIRVARPGGLVWLSWTNWLSPLGGHEWSPFHYLGSSLGPAAYRAVRRRDIPWNRPGETLFAVSVADVLGALERSPDVEVLDVVPRYWPSQRWIVAVPGLREVATWNCAVLMRRVRPA